MDIKKKIGGEFEIQPDVFSEFSVEQNFQLNRISYASGRHALLSITKYLTAKGKATIYLPNFLCESIIKTVLSENLEISFYTIKENLTIELDINELTPDSIFLVINYFGLVDYNELIDKMQSARPDVTTICDCVNAFYDMDDSKADFSFNSFRKFFAIPEGSFVKTTFVDFNESNNLFESNFHLYKIFGSLLKYNQIKDEGYLSLFKAGEAILDNSKGIYKASKLFDYLFRQIDLEDVKNKRKNNAETIFDLCHKNKLELLVDLKPGKVPSHIPIYIKNKDEIQKKLLEQNIYLPHIWPIPEILEPQKTSVLYNNILTLIVDQRYNADDMKFQINNVLKLLK